MQGPGPFARRPTASASGPVPPNQYGPGQHMPGRMDPGPIPPGQFGYGQFQTGPIPPGQAGPRPHGPVANDGPYVGGGPGAPGPRDGWSQPGARRPAGKGMGQGDGRQDQGQGRGPAGRGSQPANDGDRVLTPTTIFAPGSLINPPDGGEQGEQGAPGPGYGAAAGPGASPPPGQPGFFNGPPGRPESPGPQGFAGQGAFREHDGFYVPADARDYPAPGAPGVPPGYGPVPGYEFGPAVGDAADRLHGMDSPGGRQADFGYAAATGQQSQHGYGGQNGFAQPAGHAFTAQNGHQGSAGFDGQPGRPGGASWPGQAQPGPGGPPGQNPYEGGNNFPGQSAHVGGAGYAGPNGHPAAGGNGYPAPDEYDRTVNGGGYAYVIREEAAAAGPTSAPARPAQPARGEEKSQQPDGSTADVRAITAAPVAAPAGPAGPDPATARTAQDPDLAYGPDDPGYGPPGPDWYLRDPAEPAAAEAVVAPVVAAPAPVVAVPVRSPFEPLPRNRTAPAPGEAWPDEAGETGPGQAAAEHVEHVDYEPASYPSAGYEGADGDFGLDESADDDALGQLRNLYAGADTIGAESADGTLGQLLEKQRKLISEYFKESGVLTDGTADASDLWGPR
jgi:hypothetical protein